MKYRFQWTAPIAVSPHDPKVIYHGGQRPLPHRRRRPDLDADQPRPDPQRQDASSNGPAARSPATTPASRSTAPSSPSPSRRSRRACSGPAATTAWSTSRATAARPGPTSPRTMPGLPEWGTVSCIEPSPFDAGTAYVVVDAHRLDDTRPYLCKTDRLRQDLDSASTAGCRRTSTCTSVREDPKKQGPALSRHRARRHVLDATTARRWQPLKLNLPTVAGPRPGRQGRRPGRRHARPIALDLRRPAARPRGRPAMATKRCISSRRPTRSGGTTARGTTAGGSAVSRIRRRARRSTTR